MNRLCVVYNHAFPDTVESVRKLNEAFGDVVIVTPPGGGGDIEYYTGSYTWQAAVVEYLRSRPSEEQGHTLVVGDDVVINPSIDPFQFLAGSDQKCIHQGIWAIAGELPSPWFWHERLALAYTRPMHHLLGNGEDNPRRLLSESALFASRVGEIQQLHHSKLVATGDPSLRANWVRACISEEFAGGLTVDFGLPLYGGYSDLFSFPNSSSAMILDFLMRSVRANLFVEVAIPTMLAWSGLEVISLGERLQACWGDDRKDIDFRGALDMWNYFERNPELVAVHPVKISKWDRPS